jgi:hypothetical protein
MTAAVGTRTRVDAFTTEVIRGALVAITSEMLTGIIRANCRVPERALGDFRAQVAAIRTGR